MSKLPIGSTWTPKPEPGYPLSGSMAFVSGHTILADHPLLAIVKYRSDRVHELRAGLVPRPPLSYPPDPEPRIIAP